MAWHIRTSASTICSPSLLCRTREAGKGNGERETGAGRLDFQKHRQLQHAVLDPRLDALASTSSVKQGDK